MPRLEYKTTWPVMLRAARLKTLRVRAAIKAGGRTGKKIGVVAPLSAGLFSGRGHVGHLLMTMGPAAHVDGRGDLVPPNCRAYLLYRYPGSLFSSMLRYCDWGGFKPP